MLFWLFCCWTRQKISHFLSRFLRWFLTKVVCWKWKRNVLSICSDKRRKSIALLQIFCYRSRSLRYLVACSLVVRSQSSPHSPKYFYAQKIPLHQQLRECFHPSRFSYEASALRVPAGTALQVSSLQLVSLKMDFRCLQTRAQVSQRLRRAVHRHWQTLEWWV